MKFVRFRDGGEARYGILEGTSVYTAAGDPFAGLTKGGLVGELDNLTLLTPIQPGKIVCVGLNYRPHVLEMGRPLPDHPTYFAKLARALSDPYEPIVLPRDSARVDYEGEVVVVIGAGPEGGRPSGLTRLRGAGGVFWRAGARYGACVGHGRWW